MTTLALAATMVAAPPVLAQETAPVAEALYREGKRLLEAGQIPEACSKFAESQRVERATGTLLNLANCHDMEGKTASAWAEFTQAAEFAEQNGQKERVVFAREQAKKLEKKLRSLVLDVKQPSAGMVIRLDNQVLGNAALGTPLPVDPGKHWISVSAPAKKTWEKEVPVPAGHGQSRVEIPALEEDPSAAAPPEKPPTTIPQKPPPPPPPPPPPSTSSDARRNAGLVMGGVGVLALGTGIFLGVRSILLDNQGDREDSRAADLESVNPADPNVQSQRDAGARDHDAATSNRTIGFVAGGVGIAAIGAGIYFLVTSRTSSPEPTPTARIRDLRLTPTVGPTGHGASLSFAF